jgi:hypothetical protein
MSNMLVERSWLASAQSSRAREDASWCERKPLLSTLTDCGSVLFSEENLPWDPLDALFKDISLTHLALMKWWRIRDQMLS